MSDTCDVPLLEVLDSVPLNGRSMWEVSIHEHRNIPYGNICQQAAMRIRQLERELAEAKVAYSTLIGDYRALIHKTETNLYRRQRDEVEKQLAGSKDQLKEHQDQLTAHKAALEKCEMAIACVLDGHISNKGITPNVEFTLREALIAIKQLKPIYYHKQ